MKSPLQALPASLRAIAADLAKHADLKMKERAAKLIRAADMLQPLGLGEFGVVGEDGSIAPTRRQRMPRKKS